MFLDETWSHPFEQTWMSHIFQLTKIQDFKPVDGFDYAFVFGNEIDGVRDEFIKASKHVLEIPQEGTKHSLNVSVAAGVVLWDFYKKCGLDNT